MNTLINALIFIHFMGLAMGFAGGIAMSQVGPRLAAATAERREEMWPLATTLTRIALVGLVILLVTGPLVLWLKFNGPGGLTAWFWAKMAFVGAGVATIGLTESAKARFKRGDEAAARLMNATGTATGILLTLAVLCAVFAFN
jgi:hypothetical protein